MGVLTNGFRDTIGVFRTYGGTARNNCYPQGTRGNYARTGMMRNITAGEGITSDLVGIPAGHRHPSAWAMPQKPGALTARGTIIGGGGAAGPMQSGYNIDADITGSGGITASAGLIITMAASIVGSGGVTSGVTKALATMVASLAGSGNITASAAGLAAMTANLTGAGSINANNTALADITANIVGYGEATTQGIRDAVWSAVLANYPTAGTAGQALSTASSGGVDLNALASAVWGKVLESSFTAEEILRILAAGTAGQRAGIGTATETYTGLDGATPRIVFSPDASGNGTPVVDGS
jgi:hypothetical protein